MNSIGCTIVHFDYGGYYFKNGDNIQWVSKEDEIYTLAMRTSIDEVTYSALVDRIYKKIMVDETTTKLKLSYIPLVVDPKRPSYILDDEDVFGYLMEVNKDQCRSVLHVEVIRDVEQNQGSEKVSDGRSEVGVKNEDNIDGNNVACEGFANMDDSGILEDVEFTVDGEEDRYICPEWEDGIDLTLGQIFGSKQILQDLVYKASLQNCFEFATIKSEPRLYVIKCREFKNGCKWSLRAAKLRNSNDFSIRTYNKMHTCSRSTTNTPSSRRKGTPRLVASVLHEYHSGQFETPTPKSIIDMVEGKFGVKVSYSTALRGKKLAAKVLQDDRKEN